MAPAKTKRKKAKRPKNNKGVAIVPPPAPAVEISKVKEGMKLSPLESVLIGGDLAVLSPEQRYNFYLDVCKSLMLNPLTQPFGYIQLDGKMTLYAKKDCAEQLRKIHGVGVTSLMRSFDKEEKTVTVDVTMKDKYGKTDMASGVLYLVGQKWEVVNGKNKKVDYDLKGQERANAIMKCETKAKRRGTLSICGLSMPDESEIIDIKDAVVLSEVEVAQATGIKVVSKDPAPKTESKDEAPMDKIVQSFPIALTEALNSAGYDTLSKKYKLYTDCVRDLDAMAQMCEETIRRMK
jgi:hypothetical protein